MTMMGNTSQESWIDAPELETPVVLTEGSSDRLTIRIRDDLTVALTPAGTARQYAIARGYQEFA